MDLDQSSMVLLPMTASQGGRAIAVFAWTALAVLAGAGLLIAGASAGAKQSQFACDANQMTTSALGKPVNAPLSDWIPQLVGARRSRRSSSAQPFPNLRMGKSYSLRRTGTATYDQSRRVDEMARAGASLL
jgi:hypothetical protein